jgi:hypothetical protein
MSDIFDYLCNFENWFFNFRTVAFAYKTKIPKYSNSKTSEKFYNIFDFLVILEVVNKGSFRVYIEHLGKVCYHSLKRMLILNSITVLVEKKNFFS